MSSKTQLFVAGFVGAITLIAMYQAFEMLEPPGFNLMLDRSVIPDPSPLEGEALALLKAAMVMKTKGKREKALKLFQQASGLAPHNPDILLQYGEFLESHDIVKAEHLYNRALSFNPSDSRALTNRQRVLPKVKQIDKDMLSIIDEKRRKLFSLATGSLTLMNRAVREVCYQKIYAPGGIESKCEKNSMALSTTRAIKGTRVDVVGNSVEHSKAEGLDEAIKYINNTLLQESESISVHNILQIHKRVLRHTNPLEAGIYRVSQVYAGELVPPPPSKVQRHMSQFNEWLLSRDPEMLHPIEFAAIAHHRLVYIHPFIDGNGRTARLLTNAILMRAGFPPVLMMCEDRRLYTKHINQAHHGDIRPFIRFVATVTERTIDLLISMLLAQNIKITAP
ncbi:protein adenylyltransferase Fic-like [Exaiptasia diaphana]|uniref:protein adenylyltransferase n=1 Tax=Exaiptasia diaphana TaxID=2652724 RepID=A0A913X410_EXADI|nr:protein adenylyltransferase Fic-like [Exaiptasia diaphana]